MQQQPQFQQQRQPSRPGVPPSAWGPQVWRAIHLIALGCPPSLDASTAEAYRAFFTHLPDVLPCPSCAANYRRHLLELPIEPYLVSGEKLFEWTVRLHNIVNAELRRPGSRPDWTPEQAREALMRSVGVAGTPAPPSRGGADDRHRWIAPVAAVAFAAMAVVLLLRMRRARSGRASARATK